MVEAKWQGSWSKVGRGVVLGAAKLGLMLAFVGTGMAQTAVPVKAAKAKAVVQVPRVEEKARPQSAANQGIKVSGWWTINVKNPDGTVAQHREFENSLNNSDLLPSLLLGVYSAGVPAIYVTGANCGQGGPQCGLSTNPVACGFFVTCLASISSAAHFSAGASKADGILLTATFTATADGTVTAVQTLFSACGHGNGISPPPAPFKISDTSPAVCMTSADVPQGSGERDIAPFTLFNLNGTGAAAPIPLNSGQLVQVTVLLSFS